MMRIKISIFLGLLLTTAAYGSPISLRLTDIARIMNQNRDLPGNCRVKLLHEVMGDASAKDPVSFINMVIKRGGLLADKVGIEINKPFEFFKKTDNVTTYRSLETRPSAKCHFADQNDKCKSTRTTIFIDVDSTEKISQFILSQDQVIGQKVTKNINDIKCI